METLRFLTNHWSSLGWTIGACFLGLWLLRQVYIWRFHLASIPGPFQLDPLAYYHGLYSQIPGPNLWRDEELVKYGRLVRVGPNHVLTADPAIAKRVASLRSPNFKALYAVVGQKGLWYEHLFRFVGLTNAEKHYYQKTRALLASASNGHDNSTSPPFEAAIDAQVAKLVDLLDRKYPEHGYMREHPYQYLWKRYLKPCDFGAIMQSFALDVISTLIWSEPFGFLEEEDTDVARGYIQTVDILLPIRVAIGSLLLPIFPGLRSTIYNFWLIGPEDRLDFGMLDGIGKRIAEKRVKQVEAGDANIKYDMLTAFIAKGLRGKDLFAEISSTIDAGSHFPATVLRMAMALLVRRPAAYQRLNDEISTAIDEGRVSSPVRGVEARALPYLQAVLRETIRLYPIFTELHKEVPPEGYTIDRHRLPGGTWLGIAMIPMMRSEETWGQDADAFRPERWIEALEEKDAGVKFNSMVSIVDLALGSGKSQFLGRPHAWVVVEKAIVEMLRRFEFDRLPYFRGRGQRTEILRYMVYVVQPVHDEHLKVHQKDRVRR
ncbi:cytochrome P450 [Podospora conica]|nr:cytochrome P450 [Schizothecium conicum]